MRASSLESLLNEQSGRLVSSGRFTISPHKAREKVRQYQLAVPSAYILKIVQGLVGFWPEEIQVRLERGYTTIKAFAPRLAPDDFVGQLYQSLTGPPLAGGAFLDLAMGLNSAFARNITSLEIIDACGYKTGLLRMNASEIESGDLERALEEPLLFVRLHSKRQRIGLFARLGEFLRDLAGVFSDLFQTFDHCPCNLTVDGRRVEHDRDLVANTRLMMRTIPPPEGTPPPCLLSAPRKGPCFAYLTQPYNSGSSLVHFIQRGLRVEMVQTDLGVPGMVAYCSAHGLQTDLSGFNLVRNQAFADRIELLRQHARMVYPE